MINVDELVQNFEIEIMSSLEEVLNEAPSLGDNYELRRPIEKALEDASGRLYSALEDVLDNQYAESCERAIGVLSDAYCFYANDIPDEETVILTDTTNDVRLRITVEEA